MCGIAGVIELTDRRPAPELVLAAMAAALVHRGPDEEGFLHRPGLGLAARRLSIVDLAEGHQPMPNEDGTVDVVLYRYPLRTRLSLRPVPDRVGLDAPG
jgi:asparagine synthase (glutamine-hydrolysing)